MWLSRAFKRHRTKSFTGGNLGNNYPNVWDRILSQTRNWLREHKIKDQLQQSKEWTWTFPSHTLQNKSFWPGLMLSIFYKEFKNWQNLEMCWKCWRLWGSSDSWGVLSLLLSGVSKCSTQNTAAEQLFPGLCAPQRQAASTAVLESLFSLAL